MTDNVKFDSSKALAPASLFDASRTAQDRSNEFLKDRKGEPSEGAPARFTKSPPPPPQGSGVHGYIPKNTKEEARVYLPKNVYQERGVVIERAVMHTIQKNSKLKQAKREEKLEKLKVGLKKFFGITRFKQLQERRARIADSKAFLIKRSAKSTIDVNSAKRMFINRERDYSKHFVGMDKHNRGLYTTLAKLITNIIRERSDGSELSLTKRKEVLYHFSKWDALVNHKDELDLVIFQTQYINPYLTPLEITKLNDQT